MYPVDNKSNVFWKWNGQKFTCMTKQEFLNSIYNEFKKTRVTVYYNDLKDFLEKSDLQTKNYDWNISGNDKLMPEYLKKISYYDGFLRRINPSDYIFEAAKMHFSDKTGQFKYVKRDYNAYRYRYDPVPHTRKIKGGPSGSRRCRGIKRIFQAATDTEYGKYVRKKAIPFNLAPWYDCDEKSHDYKSWKSQKKEKQWM